MSDLKTLLAPISTFVAGLDASDPQACEAALNERFPSDDPVVTAVRDAARAAVRDGTICNRGEPGMQFSRVVKPADDPAGCSVDAVLMENAAGPAHTHTNGEFCLCLPENEGAKFEDRTDRWIVMPKGSRHVPTVRNGKMLILYWLPGGAVEWG